ncbi:MAG: hypothetical protein ACFFD5_10905 [Candidatus Thorarchaeota archaeon]
MTNDQSNRKEADIQELVIFGEPSTNEIEKKETVSLEYVDQENKIKLVNELKPYGGSYRYSLLLINQSLVPITEVKIRIRFPDFLILSRTNPPTITIDSANVDEEEQQVKIQFDKLEGNSKKQINLYLTPKNLEEKGEIRSYVTFVNNADFVRALDSDHVTLQFDPITIERKILPSSEISKFSKNPGIKKAIKSIGIGNNRKLDLGLYFSQILHVLENLNLQLITKDDDRKIAWYFGTELVSGDDILVIGQIMYGKIEWIALSFNPHLNISLLINCYNEFTRRMLMKGLIDSEDQIYDLECKHCGNILARFPKKGESIECKYCNYDQIVWK